MMYLIALILNLALLMLLPQEAILGSKPIIMSLLVVYFSMYFMFTNSKIVSFIRNKKISLPIITLGAIVLSSVFSLLSQGSISLAIFGKICIIYGTPLMMLFLTKKKKNQFHPIDFLVFLAIFVPLELHITTLPLIYLKDVVTFDGIFMTSVLFLLFTYIGNRQMNMGLIFPLNKKKWLETIFLTCILIALEIAIGSHFHIIRFAGWHTNASNAIILVIFMFFNAALLEEIFFRGLIYNYLEQYLAKYQKYIPLILNTLLFGLTHLNNGGIPMMFLSSIAGFFYCLVYMRTRSIFCATFIHAMTNICWKLLFV